MVCGNGYCGPDAAADEGYVRKEFDALLKAWRHDYRGYLDYDPYARETCLDSKGNVLETIGS